jgi:phosphate-selective porin
MRRYSKSSGAFGEIQPNKELGNGGKGAIETAIRYSSLDMTGSLNGGKQDNIAAELNWYPGGGLKFMLNHTLVNAEKNNVKDKPSITQFRAQVTF